MGVRNSFCSVRSPMTGHARPNLEYGPSKGCATPYLEFRIRIPQGRQHEKLGPEERAYYAERQPFHFNYNFNIFSGSRQSADVVGVLTYHKKPNYVDLSSFAIPCTCSRFHAPSSSSNRHFANMAGLLLMDSGAK